MGVHSCFMRDGVGLEHRHANECVVAARRCQRQFRDTWRLRVALCKAVHEQLGQQARHRCEITGGLLAHTGVISRGGAKARHRPVGDLAGGATPRPRFHSSEHRPASRRQHLMRAFLRAGSVVQQRFDGGCGNRTGHHAAVRVEQRRRAAQAHARPSERICASGAAHVPAAGCALSIIHAFHAAFRSFAHQTPRACTAACGWSPWSG